MKQILYSKDTDDKEDIQLFGIIGNAIRTDNTKEDIDGNTSATVQSATDSISEALKGGV